MKDRRDDNVRRVEEALIRHHRSMLSVEVPPLLAQKTVTRLREQRLRPENTLPEGSGVIALVWRCAMVTCLITVLMGLLSLRHDVQAEYQLAEFMMDGASSLDWVQDFGIL
jgi:hypothetical protein